MTSSSMLETGPIADLPAATAPATPPTPERLVFTGSGSEYFRIWIVNLLLTIVTLGIYSAWAKVRRLRYFYDNTRLAGSSFEYHGNPVAILKGRIVAVLLLGGYQLAFQYSPAAGFTMLALLMLAAPWLLWKSLQFKLHNSSYRGIRFGFRGNAGRAYLVYLVFPLLSVATLYLLWPFAHQRMKKFQHEESRFGTTHFSFDATAGAFYVAYLIALGVMTAGLVAIGVAFGGTMLAVFAAGGLAEAGPQFFGAIMLFFFAIYAWLFMLFPLVMTLLQNLVWSHTGLGPHRFASRMKWTRASFITLTNVIGIVLTLGLYMPFATIRMMKYRLESISMTAAGSLDDFIAANEADTAATGEGMADLLDFDLSL